MRICFVVQRYGPEVAGGAELACREFAERMAGRGHDVVVATTCARSYVDWANEYEPGESLQEGVTVHRFPVARPRDNHLFSALNPRVIAGAKPIPLHLQRSWMQEQGPYSPSLRAWVAEHTSEFDAVSFFTYLYWTTWAVLPVVPPSVPTVLHPCAHDEPPLYLQLFDPLVRLPRGLSLFTEEEGALLERRFGMVRPKAVTGIGIDVDQPADVDGFRRQAGIGDRPYLLYVGRVDPHKGAVELQNFFVTYKKRNPGPLALVVVGDPVTQLDEHPDIFSTGFVDIDVKAGAMAGAVALVQPSYFESFSLVLCEAWAQRRPALVQGRCEVLVGQTLRSGGGLPYTGYAEFEAAVDRLVGDEDLQRAMGEAGRHYVEERYHWDTVLARYERFLWSVGAHTDGREWVAT